MDQGIPTVRGFGYDGTRQSLGLRSNRMKGNRWKPEYRKSIRDYVIYLLTYCHEGCQTQEWGTREGTGPPSLKMGQSPE